MSPYPVLCYANDCQQPADYKIAARWSDGVIGELKTYFLACPKCLGELYQTAKTKKAACHLAAGETLSDPMIYELVRGQRDRELVHRPDLEENKN
jgi:hypothetical protein